MSGNCKICEHPMRMHISNGCYQSVPSDLYLDESCGCTVPGIVNEKETLCAGCGHPDSKHGLHHCLAWYDNDTPCNCETFAKLVEPGSDRSHQMLKDFKNMVVERYEYLWSGEMVSIYAADAFVEYVTVDDEVKMARFIDNKNVRHVDPDLVRIIASPVEPKPDNINHPSHYTQYKGIEVIDLTEQMNFNCGNAVKYICRAGFKSPETHVEDLKKARWYIDREIDRVLKEREL